MWCMYLSSLRRGFDSLEPREEIEWIDVVVVV